MLELNFKKTTMSFTFGIITAVAILLTPEVRAEQKCKISFKSLAENTKYTQQHTIDVGDVPGHQFRIYEVHRTYLKNAPMFQGMALKEVWRRGYSDYIDLNGRAWGYDIYVLETGAKIFVKYSGTTTTRANPDGLMNSGFNGVLTLIGGTKNFLGIRGTLRERVIFNPNTGYNEAHTEGEFWIRK